MVGKPWWPWPRVGRKKWGQTREKPGWWNSWIDWSGGPRRYWASFRFGQLGSDSTSWDGKSRREVVLPSLGQGEVRMRCLGQLRGSYQQAPVCGQLEQLESGWCRTRDQSPGATLAALQVGEAVPGEKAAGRTPRRGPCTCQGAKKEPEEEAGPQVGNQQAAGAVLRSGPAGCGFSATGH